MENIGEITCTLLELSVKSPFNTLQFNLKCSELNTPICLYEQEMHITETAEKFLHFSSSYQKSFENHIQDGTVDN